MMELMSPVEALEEEPQVPFEELLVGTEGREVAGARCGALDGAAAPARVGASSGGLAGLRRTGISLLLTFVLQFERLFFKFMKLPYRIGTLFDKRKERFDRARFAAVSETTGNGSAEHEA